MTSRMSGLPMLPPTRTVSPHAASRWPINAVVVDFPFVPVTATIGALHKRYATSISPKTGTLPACTARTAFDVNGTPGKSTALVRVAATSGFRTGAMNRRANPFTTSIASPSCSGGFSSVANTVAPRLRRTSVQARPLFPSPMTRARFAPVEVKLRRAHRTIAHARTAHATDASQKRAVTFVSGHPDNSK